VNAGADVKYCVCVAIPFATTTEFFELRVNLTLKTEQTSRKTGTLETDTKTLGGRAITSFTVAASPL
jgi:hypothetical protein